MAHVFEQRRFPGPFALCGRWLLARTTACAFVRHDASRVRSQLKKGSPKTWQRLSIRKPKIDNGPDAAAIEKVSVRCTVNRRDIVMNVLPRRPSERLELVERITRERKVSTSTESTSGYLPHLFQPKRTRSEGLKGRRCLCHCCQSLEDCCVSDGNERSLRHDSRLKTF